jgi:uncharacterized protein YdhG (YjbR/CyaY superfamily)
MNAIDEYINQFPSDIREKLNAIRKVIIQTAPQAIEKISYKMPAFYWKENLIYFAAFKTHIGIYPTSKPIEVFKEELVSYSCSKGTIKIDFNQEIPIEIIEKIVLFRLEEVENKRR